MNATAETGAHRLLDALIAADDVHGKFRSVFEVTRDGARWVITTNGHVLLAVRSDDAPAGGLEPPGNIGAVVFNPPKPTVPLGVLSTSALRQFAGERTIPAPFPCQHCTDGKVEHDCDCEFCDLDSEMVKCEDCDGTGSVKSPIPIRYGKIGRGHFNLDVVAALVPHIASDEVTAELSPLGGGYSLRMYGDGEIAIVTGLRIAGLEDADVKAAPVLEVAS